MYSYDYYDYYSFGNEITDFMEEFGYAFLGILLGVLLVMLILALVLYIFQSVGLYTIAKRRGIRNAWLAWIPVGCYWIAGSIADQYQYVVKGRVKNKRKVMLGLSIATFAISLILNVISTTMWMIAGDPDAMMTVSSMTGVFSSLINAGISIALFVFWQMSLYDLYCSCNPENSVLFVVLGVFFSITVPFFIFFNRKKDRGMPPRRPAPQNFIPPQPQQYAQPAYNNQFNQPNNQNPQFNQPQDPWSKP